MKKLINLLVCVSMICCMMIACDQPEQQDASHEGEFSVGYARSIITPQEDVPLRGYGNTSSRISNGYWDELYCTCTAITDTEGNTVLLFSLDLTNCDTIFTEIRRAVSNATNVPLENVLCSASHTHSAPDMSNTLPSITRYGVLLKEKVIQAAQDALEDRKPAEMYINTVQTENMNFIRRYVLENGETAGDNYGDFTTSPIAKHESEIDASMQLLKFTRQGGKDVIMANFQVHPHRAGGASKLNITADLVGACRDMVEQELDCHFAYFTGGSGNVNPTSRITEENVTEDYMSHGHALAKYVIEAQDSYTQAATGRVQTAQCSVTLSINHQNEDKIDIAQQILNLWKQSNNTAACVEMGKPYGINSPYHANGIVTRYLLPDSQSIDIHAFSIGDVAFITAPYEMFDSNGVQIKEGSPFKMTLIATLANESYGYIPSALGWENGGYSVDTTRFGEGSAELLVESYLSLLEQLYSTK